ncbi:MAG: 7-cyano-7-deazaguanine synthase in queuosine biosynthesis [Gammaproteobacteria bacterium]
MGDGLHQGAPQDYELWGQMAVSGEIWLTQDTNVHSLTRDGRSAQGGSLTRQGEASRKGCDMIEPSVLTLNEPPRCGEGDPLQRPAQRRSLLLWSGGLDSTYSLVRLLRTTQDRVFTHHVQCLGVDAWRGEFEHQAIERLRTRLREHDRSFVHTRSSLNLSELSGRGIDISMLSFMAAQAAMTHNLTPFDRILIGVNGYCDPGWDPNSAACALRRTRIARALRAAWGCDEVPQIYLWLPRPLKVEMVSMLGARLHKLTVSCLRPLPDSGAVECVSGVGEIGTGRTLIALRACGECAKCLNAKRMHPAGGARDGAQGLGDSAPELNDEAVCDAAARTRPLFHHLSQLSNKTPEPHRAAAASDLPAP